MWYISCGDVMKRFVPTGSGAAPGAGLQQGAEGYLSQNLKQEKGARMRLLRRFFDSAWNSRERRNYARATMQYATSPEVFEGNPIFYTNRQTAFATENHHVRPVINYTIARQINILSVKNVGVIGLPLPRISVTFYKSYTSRTYMSIGRF
jgi:hypothetical protein